MMNLMHWRLLVAVADAENVSRAAERYGITQSGASQALTQMEEALGVKVFVRDRRQTTATAIGQQIIDRARRMLSEFESIQNLVDASRGCHLGRIKLASFPSVSLTCCRRSCKVLAACIPASKSSLSKAPTKKSNNGWPTAASTWGW